MSKRSTRSKMRSKGRLVTVLLVLLLAIIVACGWYIFRYRRDSDRQAREVVKELKTLIPGLGTETKGSGSPGRDPLVSQAVYGHDVVGCLEIPALDMTVPVLDKDEGGRGFATWISGSPVKGKFRLKGGRHDAFKKLAKANPGDKVLFTDIDGTRYAYEVTTQYHIKDWDKADNDLILCYTVDENTDFVLGCTFVD